MITRLKERKIRRRLEQMFQTATARRDGTPGNEWVGYYDYLNSQEQREYSSLATEHFHLCEKLGRNSRYFVKHRDPVKNDPNSPKALLSVDEDKSVTVEFKRNLTDGKIWRYENGIKAGSYPVSENVLGIPE